jgi:nondiscriminating aspartyl-tRNA synthetase
VERILSSELPEHVGERVKLAGWLHHQRQMRSFSFVVVRDRTGIAQVVVDGAAVGEVAGLLPESVLEVEGRVIASAQAPGGTELVEPSFRVLSAPAELPPIELFRPTLKEQLPTILDCAPIALRHPRQRAAFSIAAASVAGFRAALDGLAFTEIHTPKLVGTATESGANVFEVDYFGRPAYLAQSPQFYKQMLVGVFERVYEVGPVFRAEPHDTVRHLAEYTSLDAEMGFIEDHRTVMTVAREAIAGMSGAIADRAGGAAALLGLTPPVVPAEIPAVDFTDAQAMIEAATGEQVLGELDLAPAHERWLGDWAQRTHGSDFLFVTGYPMAKRPFYTHPDPTRPAVSNSFDLLFRGLELMTGGQRLHRYEDYVAALADRGQALQPLEGYLQTFRAGMPPHGGFAIGLERWTARVTGATNIRETTLFPRDINRLTP